MRFKFLSGLSAAAMLAAATMTAAPASAQVAGSAAFSGSVTYQNPNDTAANIQFDFYNESGTLINGPTLTLQPHAAGSIPFSGVSALNTGFTRGSAVISSDKFIVATLVQYTSDPNISRMISNGFQASEASATYYSPIISNQRFGQTSLLAVQNTESFAATVTVNYYNRDTGALQLSVPRNIPAQSSAFFPSQSVGLPVGFTGSAVVTGKKQGDAATAAKIVASVNQPYDATNKAVAFEGVPSGAQNNYLASVQCKYAAAQQTTYFAIQNASLTQAATYTIAYYDARTNALVKTTASRSIGPGQKANTDPCLDGLPAGFLGSAVVRSGGQVITAVNLGSNTGLATAYIGAMRGATKAALPYIRWETAAKGYKTYTAIQNVGGSAASFTVRYYDFNGALKGTATFNNVASNAKVNTRPDDLNGDNVRTDNVLDGSGQFRGAVEIVGSGTAQLVAVVQAVTTDGTLSEAYSATPLP